MTPAAADPLAPATVAGHIAPIIDRLRLAVARRTKQLSTTTGLISSAGVGEPAFQLFMMMRNTLPDRVLGAEQLGAAFIYQRPGAATLLLDELRDADLIEGRADSVMCLSERGRDLMGRLVVVGGDAVRELWGADPSHARLLPLADRALAAAAPSGGAGFALMTPAYDAPDAADGTKLSERLAGLRFHRFDAHVAAWTAAGLTAQAVKALAPGPEREAIERETNRRAAAAYATLDPAERLELLAGLGALPG
jgi:hypothetical protein